MILGIIIGFVAGVLVSILVGYVYYDFSDSYEDCVGFFPDTSPKLPMPTVKEPKKRSHIHQGSRKIVMSNPEKIFPSNHWEESWGDQPEYPVGDLKKED